MVDNLEKGQDGQGAMVESIDMVIMQKTFGDWKLLVDSSGLARW